MADLTQTITNSTNIFGGAPSVKWGVMIWGTDEWGYGANAVVKAVDLVVAESMSIVDTFAKGVGKIISDGLGTATDIVQIYLTDAAGYNYIFKGHVTDGNQRISTDYTAQTSTDPGYSSTVGTSTTWSQV